MSHAKVLNLPMLGKDSGVRATRSLISGVTSRRGRWKLITPGDPSKHGRGSHVITADAKIANGKKYSRLLKTFSNGIDINWVNKDLKAQSGFPVMEAALGLVPGAGTAYGLLSTALKETSGEKHASVLARVKDQVVEIEQIGNFGNKTVHVARFYIVDPYRKTNRGPGMAWLFHEERHDIVGSVAM